jgi:hypothetical protein
MAGNQLKKEVLLGWHGCNKYPSSPQSLLRRFFPLTCFKLLTL